MPCCAGRGCIPLTSWSGAGPGRPGCCIVRGRDRQLPKPSRRLTRRRWRIPTTRRAERAEAELAKTKLALEIMGKAHALLEMLAESADSEPKPKP